MESSALEFLKNLLNTPSPSGFEEQIQQVIRDYVAGFADETQTDLHGNLISTINKDADFRVMLAGHCDQIGMLITHIDSDGFLYAQTIGGWDPQQLVGQRMTVWTDGGPVGAVISRKPIHLLNEEERKQVVRTQDLWLDIGSRSKEESESVVQIGDPVTLELGFRPMRNNQANAPGMDNRTGAWVVTEALRRAAKKSVKCAVYSVTTVQEEIGLRGAKTSAFGIDPHLGIAVDVTHATDCPTIDKKQQGDIKLGSGAVVYRGPNMNRKVSSRLVSLAQENEIAYQVAAIGRGASNDSNALQVTRGGVATGLVAIPNRYMHSAVETVSLDDLDAAADLIAEFLASIDVADDFTPSL